MPSCTPGSLAGAPQPARLVGKYETPATFLADPDATPSTVSVVVLDLQFGEHTADLSAPVLLSERGFRVVAFAQHIRSDIVLDCLDLSAVTHLSKLEGEDHLVAGLHAAGADRPYLSPTMAQAMTEDTRPSKPVLSAAGTGSVVGVVSDEVQSPCRTTSLNHRRDG